MGSIEFCSINNCPVFAMADYCCPCAGFMLVIGTSVRIDLNNPVFQKFFPLKSSHI